MPHAKEIENREKKVKAVVAYLLRELGQDLTHEELAQGCALMSRDWWTCVFTAAGQNPPGKDGKTIEAVLDFIRQIESRTVAA